jgi:hypothetical protein
METAVLTPDHDNFIKEYHLQVQRDQTDLINKIQALKQELENKICSSNSPLVKYSFEALFFEQHLYQSLMSMDMKDFKDI